MAPRGRRAAPCRSAPPAPHPAPAADSPTRPSAPRCARPPTPRPPRRLARSQRAGLPKTIPSRSASTSPGIPRRLGKYRRDIAPLFSTARVQFSHVTPSACRTNHPHDGRSPLYRGWYFSGCSGGSLRTALASPPPGEVMSKPRIEIGLEVVGGASNLDRRRSAFVGGLPGEVDDGAAQVGGGLGTAQHVGTAAHAATVASPAIGATA